MNQKGFINIIIIIGIVIFAVIAGYFIGTRQTFFQKPAKEINSFEECVKAEYPVAESYPRQCWTPDGRHFVEKLTIEQAKELLSQSFLDKSGVVGVGVGACGGEPCIKVMFENELGNLPNLKNKIPSESHGFKVETEVTGLVCTQEVKQCPDGSYVSRTGENCEFAKCPAINPQPVTECKKDSDCPSQQYICEETQSIGTACPENDPSCVPTHTVIKGECKLKEGNRCSVDLDCVAGNLCHKNICASPVGRQCNGPSDTSCPSDYECVQGCGSPVGYPGEPPPPYFCQLKGYIRPCPICLTLNTLIDTPFGAVPVQQLQKGTSVWTINKSGERVAGIVVKTSRVPVALNHQMVHLVLDDGRELFVSPGHPLIDGRTVGNLAPGDLYDGVSVVSAERVPYGKDATHDILPSGETGFYWANGILFDSTLH